MGTSFKSPIRIKSSYPTSNMSSSTTAVNTFNKSKEDFIWFVKKAVQDKKSYSYSELYHSLLKLFVDADTNKDGLVSKASFSKLIDAAATLPRAYGYAPADSDLYKTEAEAIELYWYMLEIFTDHDADKDGIIKLAEFNAMMKEFLAVPLKHELPVPCCEQFEVIFKKYDPRNDGRLTVDEWMSLAKEEVYKKFL